MLVGLLVRRQERSRLQPSRGAVAAGLSQSDRNR